MNTNLWTGSWIIEWYRFMTDFIHAGPIRQREIRPKEIFCVKHDSEVNPEKSLFW